MNLATKIILLICFGIAIFSTHTCLQIEIHNARIGYYLPRNHDAEWGISKWRSSPITTEFMWRQARIRDGSPQYRPLTSEEKERMTQDIKHAKLWNELRDWVEGFGLLQYLLIPILIILSIVLIIRKTPKVVKILASAFLLIGLINGFFMIYRGYFSSLGW